MKKIRYALETKALLFMAWLMRTLPRHIVLALCKVVGLVAWLCDARGRSDGTENLRVIFPQTLTWWQRHGVVLAAYQNFARTFADLFWVKNVSPASWQKHFTLHLSPGAEAYIQSGRGSVWVTPHYGNFELASIVWGYLDMRFTIVAQDFKNPALTHVFSEARSVTGHRIIPQENAMIRLLKILIKGGRVAFLTDLSVKPDKAAEAITSFGRKACVTKIHIAMARRLGLPVQPAVCRPLPDGRYEVVAFEPIEIGAEETDNAATQRVWDVFEKEIRQHPSSWMWMYKHWRYKPMQTHGVEYPSYANEWKEFEKVLARNS